MLYLSLNNADIVEGTQYITAFNCHFRSSLNDEDTMMKTLLRVVSPLYGHIRYYYYKQYDYSDMLK